jgi:hypothetical protein
VASGDIIVQSTRFAQLMASEQKSRSAGKRFANQMRAFKRIFSYVWKLLYGQ